MLTSAINPGDDRHELVRADNHDVRIVGTSESMLVTYPIRPELQDDGTWSWTYTGGDSTEHDETAEQLSDEQGEPLFQDENGNDVPASQVMVLIYPEDEEEEPTAHPLAFAATPPKRIEFGTELAEIVAQITAFDRRCEAEEKTDTGDAWDLFNDIRDRLRALL